MGTYTRIKRLGGGGFGDVYLEHHEGLDVNHAVKYVLPSAVTTPSEFFKEPRLLEELQHDHIVKVFDTWDEAGRLHIAMEYLSRGSLAKLCERGPVPLKRVKHILCQCLKSLQYVHDKGFVHRDLKPDNILIGKNGEGKISDFGLAIPTSATLYEPPAGTLPYVAPEVLITGEMGVKSDVYAIGVTLYEALNGASYLPAHSKITSLQNAITSGKFPDRTYYRIFIPRALKMVVNKAMHPDPNKRFGCADELRHALERIPIYCSWKESRVGGTSEWISEQANEVITVALTQKTGGWNVETFRKKTSAQARRVGRMCGSFSKEKDALARVSEITVGLVSGLDSL
jgi:eukaryotic-like serine/threonine-protein kinase